MRNVGQHNKYKTKRCQKYWIAGYCAYGPRCNFLHSEKEDQVVPKPGPGAGAGLASHRRQSQAQLRKGSVGEVSVDTSGGSGASLPRTTPSSSPPHIKVSLVYQMLIFGEMTICISVQAPKHSGSSRDSPPSFIRVRPAGGLLQGRRIFLDRHQNPKVCLMITF